MSKAITIFEDGADRVRSVYVEPNGRGGPESLIDAMKRLANEHDEYASDEE